MRQKRYSSDPSAPNETGSQWEQIQRYLATGRRRAGRHGELSALIVDGPSVPSTRVGGISSFDAFREAHGRKRHIAVDTHGLLRYAEIAPIRRDCSGAWSSMRLVDADGDHETQWALQLLAPVASRLGRVETVRFRRQNGVGRSSPARLLPLSTGSFNRYADAKRTMRNAQQERTTGTHNRNEGASSRSLVQRPARSGAWLPFLCCSSDSCR